MKQGIYRITENSMLVPGIFRMRLAGDVSAFTAPGQFLNIALAGRYLRRPISLCDLQTDAGEGTDGGKRGVLTIIYKTVGAGTEQLSGLPCGSELDILTGLGNGYDLSEQGLAQAGESPLLIGGGVGVPPLYYLAKQLCGAGKKVSVILGFNTASEVFYEEEFRALGCAVTVTTVDGSYGTAGFATDALPADFTYVYACGPEPMLKAVYRTADAPGQYSFEERMGCGFGACMGCTCRTVTGYKRICKDGPVLRKEEILWEK